MGGRLGPERVELHQLGRTLSNDDHDDHNQHVGDFYFGACFSLQGFQMTEL